MEAGVAASKQDVLRRRPENKTPETLTRRKRHLNREALHRKVRDDLELLGFEGAAPLAAGLLRSGRTLLNGKKIWPQNLSFDCSFRFRGS